jgi:hypothetical protein
MSGPPPDIAAAAAKVQAWLDAQKTPANPPPARPLSDAEKLDRARTFDQSKMPEWRDPRTP